VADEDWRHRPENDLGELGVRVRLALGLAAVLGCVAFGAQAQTRAGNKIPASIEGDWRVNFILPMESTPETPKLVVSEAEARPAAARAGKALSDFFAAGLDPELPQLVLEADGLPIVRGERRTRAVIVPADGRLPYTPVARKEAEDTSPPPDKRDNPEDRGNADRCLVGQGQPPLSSFALDSQIKIVVTRGTVAIYIEYGADLRIIPLTRAHQPKVLWGRLGDSVAHWEGKTLVIETVGQPDADRFHVAPVLLVPGESTVIERLTPVSEKELLYQFTVVDPKTYTAPWLGEFSWYRTAQPIYEHACHEGNYALTNILAGARYEESLKK